MTHGSTDNCFVKLHVGRRPSLGSRVADFASQTFTSVGPRALQRSIQHQPMPRRAIMRRSEERRVPPSSSYTVRVSTRVAARARAICTSPKCALPAGLAQCIACVSVAASRQVLSPTSCCSSAPPDDLVKLACFAKNDASARHQYCSGDVCRWDQLRKHMRNRADLLIADNCSSPHQAPHRPNQRQPAPIFPRATRPLRVLFVEDYFPNQNAAWRLNEARAFIERHDTDFLSMRRPWGWQTFDWHALRESHQLYRYDILIFDHDWNDANALNERTSSTDLHAPSKRDRRAAAGPHGSTSTSTSGFDGTRYNAFHLFANTSAPPKYMLRLKRHRSSDLDFRAYDVIYCLFLDRAFEFAKLARSLPVQQAPPVARMVVKAYPGGGAERSRWCCSAERPFRAFIRDFQKVRGSFCWRPLLSTRSNCARSTLPHACISSRTPHAMCIPQKDANVSM